VPLRVSQEKEGPYSGEDDHHADKQGYLDEYIPDLARLNPADCLLAANPITYVKISCLLEAPPGAAGSQPDKDIFDALVIPLETKGNRLYGSYKPAIPEKARGEGGRFAG